jgi:hypothetical protein
LLTTIPAGNGAAGFLKWSQPMFDLNDVNNIEGEAASPVEYYKSLQRAINAGVAWQFQGHYGRSMMEAIKEGRCLLGLNDCHDYYGNHIPSRTQIKEGTKGSRGFVADTCGEQWAQLMEGVI